MNQVIQGLVGIVDSQVLVGKMVHQVLQDIQVHQVSQELVGGVGSQVSQAFQG